MSWTKGISRIALWQETKWLPEQSEQGLKYAITAAPPAYLLNLLVFLDFSSSTQRFYNLICLHMPTDFSSIVGALPTHTILFLHCVISFPFPFPFFSHLLFRLSSPQFLISPRANEWREKVTSSSSYSLPSVTFISFPLFFFSLLLFLLPSPQFLISPEPMNNERKLPDVMFSFASSESIVQQGIDFKKLIRLRADCLLSTVYGSINVSMKQKYCIVLGIILTWLQIKASCKYSETIPSWLRFLWKSRVMVPRLTHGTGHKLGTFSDAMLTL